MQLISEYISLYKCFTSFIKLKADWKIILVILGLLFRKLSKLQWYWTRMTYDWSFKLHPLQHPRGYMIMIQALGQLVCITTVTVSHSHMTTICNLLYWLRISRVSGQSNRRFQVTPANCSCSYHFFFWGSFRCMGILYSVVHTS